MAVVKADAYGHGAVPCARAAKQAGAAWLGTALPEEALQLRAAGLTGPILAWLHPAGGPWDELIAHEIDVTAYAPWVLEEITAAAQRLRHPGARAAQGRHRPRPRRHPAARLAGAGRAGRQGRGRRAHPGHRRVVALRLRRRARPPLHPGPAGRLPPGAGHRRPRGPAPGGPAHRQQPGHPEPAGVALRPGPRGPGALWPLAPAGHRPRRLRPAPGDDAGGARRAGQERPGRARRVLRPHPPHRRRPRPWRWSRSATPTACPATPPTSARS